MVQMKEQIKTLEKEWSDQDIANLSDAELKTLVLRIFKAMIEYGHKIKKKAKAI